MNIKYFFKFQTKRLILISHLFFISCDKHEQIKEENNENIKEQITLEKYDCGSNSTGISHIMLNKNIKNVVSTGRIDKVRNQSLFLLNHSETLFSWITNKNLLTKT